MSDVTTDVLVVGGGPAGLAAALCLAKYGVNSLLITKHRWTANSPRAHITNQRTLEIFRDLGLEDAVLRAATPAHLMANNVWATSLAGREIARLQTWGNEPRRKSDWETASPSPMCNIPQHILEPIIAQEAMKSGAVLRFATEYLSLTQDDDGVTVRVRDRISEHEYEIRAKYVIGADGGNSRVAADVGLALDGEMGIGAAVNVWFRADLTKYCAHRPGVLYWITQPGSDFWVGSGTLICVRPWTEWVMLFMYVPSEGEPDLTSEALTARIRRIVGDADLPTEILGASKWQINRMVAQNFSAGRVFCAGDAVHRHPPANGLGTNTSIQDSYNLAWKLRYVLAGIAAPSLLGTYSAERQPVGHQVVERAIKSVTEMAPIAEALGFRHGQSAQEGWRNLDILDEESDRGRDRRAALRSAIEHTNYQYNAHGIELGQRYASAAVVADGTPEPSSSRDAELYYEPTTWPGARLPHVWLERNQRRISSLDLVGRGTFVAITGIRGSTWETAAHQVSAAFNVPLEVVRIGGTSAILDVYGDWQRLREVDEDGCILVRPDGYVGWRSATCPSDAAQLFEQAVQQILGRNTPHTGNDCSTASLVTAG